MKVIVLALFASLAVGGVFGNDKANAIEEINMKYNETFTYCHTVTKQIMMEMKKTDPTKKNETIEYVKTLKSNTLRQFAEEVRKTSRTAVVKNKPLSAFECIATVARDGRGQILGAYDDFLDTVDNVVHVRESRLEISLLAAGLILDAVTELKGQAIKSIQDADSGIKSLKEEALRRIESGKKQIGHIEASIHKPTLSDEYVAVKQHTEAKLKDMREALCRKVQKCI